MALSVADLLCDGVYSALGLHPILNVGIVALTCMSLVTRLSFQPSTFRFLQFTFGMT